MRIVVLDIGGTEIKSGIIENGNLSLKIKTPSNAQLGGPYIIDTAKSIISGYGDINGIGISTAGQVDSEKGMIVYSNQNILDYTGMKIQDIFQAAFNVPVAVENDVNAVAVSETIFGVGKTHNEKNFICLTYGTGVGGAIVYNGEIFRGASFSAAEFGHIITHGTKNESGYYEKYASTNALIEKIKAVMPDLNNGRKIFMNMEVPVVKEIIDDWIQEIIYGLVSLIHIFNPSLIVLGGGVMCQDYVIQTLQQEINAQIMPSFCAVKLVPASLGNDSGLWGVGYLAGLKLNTVIDKIS